MKLNNWEMDVEWIRDIDYKLIDEEETSIVFQCANEIHDLDKGKPVKSELSRSLALIVSSLINDKELRIKLESMTKEEVRMCEVIENLVSAGKNAGRSEERQAIAKKMVDNGYDDKEIYNLTGLKKEDLK